MTAGSRLTAKQIESAILKKFGMSVRVHRDSSGYYYFYSDDRETDLRLNRWPSTSVYTYRMNWLTLEQWLDNFAALKEDGEDS